MATNIVYIHDLPFKPRHQLCRILDADRRWEELGGNHMGYDVTTLTLIGQSIHRDKSPTWELLNKYSEKNGKIQNLFIMLAKMDHQRAMSVLQPYVEEKLHQLLRTESPYSTAFLNGSRMNDIPKPSFSQLSVTTTNSLSQHSQSLSTLKGISGAHGTTFKGKETFSVVHSKLDNDLDNMNKSFSSVSLQSKLKSLNVPHTESKVGASKKSPDLSRFKKSSFSKDQSISDNCASGKPKNGNELSIQEALLNEKHTKRNPRTPSGANYTSQDDALPDIMRIPYSEICKATDNFNEARILGRGGFGTVYKGEWKGTSVAIKRLTPRKSSDNPSQQLVSLKQSLNELNILKCCRFDHILPLYAVSLDGANPCLIYQLMVNGSLEDRLFCKNKTPPLTWLQRSHIAECTAKGLNYLHTTYGKPLVHGDIKSANILLDNNMDAKIGDFGLTREGPGSDNTHVKVTSVHGTECYLPPEYLRHRQLSPEGPGSDTTHVKVTSVHGTECYLPPEYLRHRQLSPQVDIFSFGIVMLEIATGLRPFDPKRETKRLVEYVRLCDDSGRLDSLRDAKAGEENMLWFRELIQIGQVCSSYEKKKRPPMQKVLGQFEKVKTDMSMMDRIRRLSNDKGNPIKQMKFSPEMNLTPIEIQIMYDLRNSQSAATSENNKLLNIPLENGAATSAIPLVIDQMKDVSISSRESESSVESLDRRDSYISSDSSSQGESDYSSISSKLINRGASSTEKRQESDPGVPPMPLISILQLQVPEIEEPEKSSSEKS